MTIFDVDSDVFPDGSADMDRYRGQVVLVVTVASAVAEQQPPR